MFKNTDSECWDWKSINSVGEVVLNPVQYHGSLKLEQSSGSKTLFSHILYLSSP